MWLFTIYKYEQVCKASRWKQLWNQICSSKASPHPGQGGTRYWSSKNVFCAGMKQAAQSSRETSETIFSSNVTLPQCTRASKYEYLTDTLGALMATPFSNPEINWTETASDAFSSAITAWHCKCSKQDAHMHTGTSCETSFQVKQKSCCVTFKCQNTLVHKVFTNTSRPLAMYSNELTGFCVWFLIA